MLLFANLTKAAIALIGYFYDKTIASKYFGVFVFLVTF